MFFKEKKNEEEVRWVSHWTIKVARASCRRVECAYLASNNSVIVSALSRVRKDKCCVRGRVSAADMSDFGPIFSKYIYTVHIRG